MIYMITSMAMIIIIIIVLITILTRIVLFYHCDHVHYDVHDEQHCLFLAMVAGGTTGVSLVALCEERLLRGLGQTLSE